MFCALVYISYLVFILSGTDSVLFTFSSVQITDCFLKMSKVLLAQGWRRCARNGFVVLHWACERMRQGLMDSA